MGATLDIPVHHIKAMLVRSHFDAMEIRVPDAPAADELLLALAVTDGGRPHARVGGLKAEDAVGEDGLRLGAGPGSHAMRTLITNLGTVVTGDIDAPLARRRLDPDRGRPDRRGRPRARRRRAPASSIDAKGTTALPGLIDSHAHPVFGDFTPRQQTMTSSSPASTAA